jgi:hypothetical protein
MHGGAGLAALMVCGAAQATSYRCDDGGRITYSNLPCTSGRQTELADRDGAPSAADRAAAEARHRANQAQLDANARALEREGRQNEKAAALASRRNAAHGKEAAACAKLALRAKRAREDYDTAGPRDQPAKRVRMRRAEDDYTSACRKR